MGFTVEAQMLSVHAAFDRRSVSDPGCLWQVALGAGVAASGFGTGWKDECDPMNPHLKCVVLDACCLASYPLR